MQTEFLMKHLEEVISSSTSCGHCFTVQFFRKTKLHETRNTGAQTVVCVPLTVRCGGILEM